MTKGRRVVEKTTELLAESLVSMDALRSVVKQVAPGQKSTLPILESVGLDLDEATIGAVSTDLETSVWCGVNHGTRIHVPHRTLRSLVEQIEWSGVAQLRAYTDRLEVRVGTATFNLRTLPAEDFPVMNPDTDRTVLGIVDSEQFRQTLDGLLRFASTDEARPVLTSVLFEPANADLRLVATDSYRMRAVTLPRAGVGLGEGRRLVSRRALASWWRRNYDGPVTVSAGDGSLTLDTDLATWKFRTIEGEFPHYARVYPSRDTLTLRITAERALLAAAVRVVRAVCTSGQPLRLSLTDEGSLRVWAEASDVGDVSYLVPCEHEGEPVTVAVNPAYLLDCLVARDQQTTELRMQDGLKPVLIDDDTLLMPVRQT